MTACPACARSSFDEASGICSVCGYAEGARNECPHCGAVARITGEGRSAVCAVCGGPRIPANRGGDEAKAALREQKRHLGKARLLSLATMLQGLIAVVAACVGLLLAPATLTGKIVAFLLAAAPLFLALRARSNAGEARAKADAAGERAWQAAAEELARGDGISAAGAAKELGIDEAGADRLLTELAVHDRTRVDVGEDAEVVYSATEPERTEKAR